MRGEVDHRKCRGLLEGHCGGHLEYLPFGQHESVRVTAKLWHAEHTVTHGEPCHAQTYGVDDAGDLVTDDARKLGCVWIQSDTSHEIGEIDPRSAHADANPALVRSGIGCLP